MGIPLPSPEIDTGTDCAACTGPDKLWDAGKTPEFVYATFHNLNACPNFSGILPNGMSFKCAQEPGRPCWWRHQGSVWYVSFYAKIPAENQSELLLVYVPDNKLAFQARDEHCRFEFYGYSNLILNCTTNVCATDGIGVVSWNDIPLDFVAALGLTPGQSLFLEPFVHVDGDRVVKFCSKQDSTNIRIKFQVP